MPSIRDVGIDQRFSFEVYPTNVLGNNFRDVRLEGVISARTAASYGVDIESLHALVYPTVPQGTMPNDPFQYNYIRIQFPNGEYMVIGELWIRPETIVISNGGQATLTFNDITQVDLERMQKALSANGFRPDDVNIHSN